MVSLCVHMRWKSSSHSGLLSVYNCGGQGQKGLHFSTSRLMRLWGQSASGQSWPCYSFFLSHQHTHDLKYKPKGDTTTAANWEFLITTHYNQKQCFWIIIFPMYIYIGYKLLYSSPLLIFYHHPTLERLFSSASTCRKLIPKHRLEAGKERVKESVKVSKGIQKPISSKSAAWRLSHTHLTETECCQ